MERPSTDKLIELGLYDPDDELGAERLALIDYLFGLGATVDELVEAAPALWAVASTRALRGPGDRFTGAELAVRAGVSVDESARVWRAAGFPDPGPDARIYTDEDVEVLRVAHAAGEWLGEDMVLQVVRVIGSSMARVADAAIAAFIVNVVGPVLEEDPGGLALARANTDGVALLRQASSVMDVLFRRHAERLQRPLSDDDPRTQQLAIGFANLVGSTAFAHERSIKDLGAALVEFDELVSDVVLDAGGRVVKLIGDEVMFVASEPAVACEIALEPAERLSDHPRLPPVRGGLAFGAALSRDGDYFGPVVNLASRIVTLARPGAVRATTDLRDAVETYRFESIGTPTLKGFDEPLEVYEVHRS